MDTRLRTLVRATIVAGGPEQLAARLGVSRQAVCAMLEKTVPVPQWVFLRLVDIVTDAPAAEETAV
jgi:hypothetical protein